VNVVASSLLGILYTDSGAAPTEDHPYEYPTPCNTRRYTATRFGQCVPVGSAEAPIADLDLAQKICQRALRILPEEPCTSEKELCISAKEPYTSEKGCTYG